MPFYYRQTFLLCVLLLVLVALPRFNRNPVLIEVPRADDRYYEMMVHYFQGEGEPQRVSNFYFRRPLLPLLASILPFSAMTSLNLLNLGFLLLGLYSLMRSLAHIGASSMGRLLGGIVFAVSFPMFYYATIGYVDAAAVGMLTFLIWLVMQRQFGWLLLLIPFAASIKETTILILLFFPLWLYAQGELARKWFWPLLTLSVFFLSNAALRWWAPGAAEPAVWKPQLEVLAANASRWRAWISGLLTLGLPALGAILWWRHRRKLQSRVSGWPFFISGMAAVGIWVYAWLAAYADGRFLWSIYPFWIPLLVLWWDYQAKKPKINRSIAGDRG